MPSLLGEVTASSMIGLWVGRSWKGRPVEVRKRAAYVVNVGSRADPFWCTTVDSVYLHTGGHQEAYASLDMCKYQEGT